MIIDSRLVTDSRMTYTFGTPDEVYDKITYKVFEMNKFFIYDGFGDVKFHKISWENKNDALTLFNKSKYIAVDYINSNNINVNEERLVAHALINDMTFYTGKDPYQLVHVSNANGKLEAVNGYKRLVIMSGSSPYVFHFASSTTHATSLAVWDFGNGKYEYEIIGNTKQYHTFVLRDANYRVTDIIQFTK